MAELKDLSTTDASNNGSAANAGFAEGMAPSDVNNAARALEGMLARWLADNNGTLTTGGSSNAYTLAAPNQTISAYYDGLTLMFEANHTNTDAATLNVNSLGAQSILRPDGGALKAGAITSGGRYTVCYDGTNFLLVGADTLSSGTWTPVLTCSTPGSLAVSYTKQTGNYTRNGTQVFFGFDLRFTITDATGASGAARITGLPFASDASKVTTLHPAQTYDVSGPGAVAWPTGVSTLFGYIQAGTQYVQIFGNGDGGVNQSFDIDVWPAGDLCQIRVTGAYETDEA